MKRMFVNISVHRIRPEMESRMIAYHAQLNERGVDVDDEVSRFGDPIPPLFWFRDPEGNRLMVVEVAI